MTPSLLPSLAWFAQIAQHRSFTKAAAELGVTRAALSQNLKALEERLNVKLLYRTTRDMSVTEAGQHLLDALQPALRSVEGALSELGDAQAEPQGLLRINTSRVAARMLLEPHLDEFLARCPKLRVELVIADGFSNIVAEGCDAGIRLGQSLAEHVVAVPITPMLDMAVVGAPSYFDRHGIPESPADLVRHDCLRYRQTSSGAIFRWEFYTPGMAGGDFVVEPTGSLVTNDDECMIRTALRGLGLMQHMTLAIQEHLQTGQLVRVLQAWCTPFPGFYLYVPSRAQMPAKTRALREFLVEKRDLLRAPAPVKRRSATIAKPGIRVPRQQTARQAGTPPTPAKP